MSSKEEKRRMFDEILGIIPKKEFKLETPIEKERTFVLCGSRREYENFMYDNDHLSPHEYVHLYRPDQLHGATNFNLIKIGSYYQTYGKMEIEKINYITNLQRKRY